MQFGHGAERRLGDTGVDAALFAVLDTAFGPVTRTWNGGHASVSRDQHLDFWLLAGSLAYCLTETWALAGAIVSTLGVSAAPDVAVLRLSAVSALTTRVKLDGAVAAWG